MPAVQGRQAGRCLGDDAPHAHESKNAPSWMPPPLIPATTTHRRPPTVHPPVEEAPRCLHHGAGGVDVVPTELIQQPLEHGEGGPVGEQPEL